MSQAEVGGVVTEEYAEPSRAIFSDPATNDDAAQCDRLAITTLQTQQARTVTAGISARQVTYLQPLHPDRHGVSVIRIVILGNQHRIDGLAYPLIRPADPPDATDSPGSTTRRRHPDRHCRPGAQLRCHHAPRAMFHPRGFLQVWPAYLGSPSAPPGPSWTTAQYGGTACAVAVRGVR